MSDHDLIRAVENGDLTFAEASAILAAADAWAAVENGGLTFAEASAILAAADAWADRCPDCNAIVPDDGQCDDPDCPRTA